MSETEDAGQFTEDILNIVLDEIDDIIIIHDSEHTVVWMNHAALKTFNETIDDAIGKRCYHLFGKSCHCEDCPVTMLVGGNRGRSIRIIPGTGERFECISTPIMKKGEMKLVVQHLKHMDPEQ